MSLLRNVVLASAVIALLPSDPGQQERLQKSIADAAHWSMTFCARNAKTCDTASAAWDTFKQKAAFAADMAYGVAMQHAFGSDSLFTTASTAPAGPAAPSQTVSVRLDYPRDSSRGTLTARDMEPGWRGTLSRKGL